MNRFPNLLTTHLLSGYLTTCGTGSTANQSSGECNDTGPVLSFGLTHVSFDEDLRVIHE